MAVQEYKCPCCSGALAFDSTVQKMKCPFCDTEFEVETLKAYDEDLKSEGSDKLEWDTDAGTQWTVDETTGLRSYVCKNCGGEIVGDENTAATECPFCGNHAIIMQQFSGTLKPDYVIPFKLDKEKAKEQYRQHLNKFLVPNVFKEENHIDEIKGIYVPFWLFDSNADADIRFRATRTRSWSDSDYNYIETSYYSVFRAGSIGYDHVPVDGTSRLANDLMESVEPYKFSDAVDFQTAYLSGYFADKYDVSAEDSIARANERIKNSTEDAFRNTVKGYMTVEPENTSVRLHDGKTKYAFYPVWLMNTTYNGEKFTFAMNGQTGKFVGNLPTDKSKFWKLAAAITAAVGALVYAGMWIVELL